MITMSPPENCMNKCVGKYSINIPFTLIKVKESIASNITVA